MREATKKGGAAHLNGRSVALLASVDGANATRSIPK
jgi:hypothetical protein